MLSPILGTFTTLAANLNENWLVIETKGEKVELLISLLENTVLLSWWNFYLGRLLSN